MSDTPHHEPGLSVQDLDAIRNIIAVAAQRGAFADPKEYAQIGQVFTKLDLFLEHIKSQTADADANEAPATDAEHTTDKETQDGEV